MRRVLKDMPVANRSMALKLRADRVAGVAPKAAAAPADPPIPSATDERLLAQRRLAAEQRGYEAGLQQAQADVSARLEQELARLAHLIDTIRMRHAEHCRQLADVAEPFAFAVLCRLLGEQAAAPAAVEGTVRATLEQIPGAAAVALRVHPGDAPIVENLVARGTPPAEGTPRIEVRGDPAVELGGCIVEAASGGSFDASFDTQLRALQAALEAARHERRSKAAP